MFPRLIYIGLCSQPMGFSNSHSTSLETLQWFPMSCRIKAQIPTALYEALSCESCVTFLSSPNTLFLITHSGPGTLILLQTYPTHSHLRALVLALPNVWDALLKQQHGNSLIPHKASVECHESVRLPLAALFRTASPHSYSGLPAPRPHFSLPHLSSNRLCTSLIYPDYFLSPEGQGFLPCVLVYPQCLEQCLECSGTSVNIC